VEKLTKILFIEHTESDSRLIRDALKDAPRFAHEVYSYPTVAAALARVDEVQPDVLLLDLGDAKDLENVTKLRVLLPHLPLVALTNNDDEQVGLAVMQHGAQDYLVKEQMTGHLLLRALRYAVERKCTEDMQRRELETERTERFRERFIGILGHDLRNPLQSITMSAALLLGSDDLAPQHRRCAQRIASASDRMARMINDLLDFTRARLGGGYPIVRAGCDLHVVLRQVIDELRAAQPDATIKFETHGDGTGAFDADRVAQVASNLVANALRYGDRRKPIAVTTRDDDGQFVLTVHNFGPAIPKAVMANLFDPFYRARPENHPEGLGLGLYIAQEIVAAHGGTIAVKSSADEGTTFDVRLPR
jgi:phosphoserine phosphatase RsbU/P